MKTLTAIHAILLLPAMLAKLTLSPDAESTVPKPAIVAAEYAVEKYDDAQVGLLEEMVKFRTFHRKGVDNWEHPEFRRFVQWIRHRAEDFGLDFQDHGSLLVIGLGDSAERVGFVTHADVQPADASKWAKSPFALDRSSEPGRLVARGTEDNKAPIATAMYAMRAIMELEIPLGKRIELIVSLTEESDWDAFRAALDRWDPPKANIAIDSEYPVVVAEKGWGSIRTTFSSPEEVIEESGYEILELSGGSFLTQVPEDATLRVSDADAGLVRRMQRRIKEFPEKVGVSAVIEDGVLTVSVTGRSFHSMYPQNGLNAIAYASVLMQGESIHPNAPGQAIKFVNELLGTDVYARNFGNVAFEHDFMGPLTVNLSTATMENGKIELAFNTRAPAGKSPQDLQRDFDAAISEWADENALPDPQTDYSFNAAYFPAQQPQVEPLIGVFEHFTGIQDPQPVSIPGATNASLLPNGVNFGPSMPGKPYTGHSEHEFIEREQMTLNLQMYTAAMVYLAQVR